MKAHRRWVTRWPVHQAREQGVYCYQQPISGYPEQGHITLRERGGVLMLGSYSYLGLNGHPRINEAACAAIQQYGTGTPGVRLLAGTLDIHRELELRIARFKKAENALVFGSGYFANVSTISSMFGPGDTVICDKLNHASIIDGCKLSKAAFVRYRHNDMENLERLLKACPDSGHRVVIADAVFSMDGDVMNLPETVALCRQYSALLMVDEAHSIGVLGANGHGIEDHFGLPPDCVDIKMGTLSKAIPSMGGYIAASNEICDFVSHQARAFIYSAALSPSSAAAALMALDILDEEPERVSRLHENCARFRKGLQDASLNFNESTESAIFPIFCGDDWSAYRLAAACLDRGLFIQAIPHPVVPKGTARLRASITADLGPHSIDQAVDIIRDCAEYLGMALRDSEVPHGRALASNQ